MATDLNHKYKDRDPVDTINIIQNFFLNKKYNINMTKNEKSDADTFWCHLELKTQDGKVILTSNGKGSTMEYSLASGHAELYERYCAGFQNNLKDLFKQYRENKNNYNYYYSEDEQLFNFNEIYNSNILLKSFFDLTGREDSINYHNFVNSLEIPDNKLPCVPFINLKNQQKLYFNLSLLNCMQGSDGLAAGNTLEEAIVQGMSEIYEHYVTDRLYYDNSKDVIYFQLNLPKIKQTLPEYLINIIDKIEQSGCYLYIYDLSYNFNMPVLMSIIVDKNHQVYLNTGAAPVFNIALERVLTEIYQGRQSFSVYEYDKSLIKPYRNYSIEESIFNNASSFTMRNNYPEELLLNKIIVGSYNKEVFLEDKEYTNTDLMNYYIQLNEKNNFEIYYRDLSQVKEIFVVRLFCTNKVIFPWKYNIYLQLDETIRNDILNLALQINQEKEYSDNYFSLLEKLEDIMNSFMFTNNLALKEFISFIFGKHSKIFPVSTLENFFNYYTTQCLSNPEVDEIEKHRYAYLNSLYYYKVSNKYSDQEILNIFINIFKYNNLEEILLDLENIQDKKYVIRKIFNIKEE